METNAWAVGTRALGDPHRAVSIDCRLPKGVRRDSSCNLMQTIKSGSLMPEFPNSDSFKADDTGGAMQMREEDPSSGPCGR